MKETVYTKNRIILFGIVLFILIAGFTITFFNLRPDYYHQETFEKKDTIPAVDKIKMYDDSIKKYPEQPWYLYKRAKLYIASGEYERALKDLEKLKKLKVPEDLDSLAGKEIQTLRKIIQISNP